MHVFVSLQKCLLKEGVVSKLLSVESFSVGGVHHEAIQGKGQGGGEHHDPQGGGVEEKQLFF